VKDARAERGAAAPAARLSSVQKFGNPNFFLDLQIFIWRFRLKSRTWQFGFPRILARFPNILLGVLRNINGLQAKNLQN
jgi:hypothetical protein